MPARTLGAELAHALKARGVDTIFGIPGVHNVELYRGIEEAGITHVLARHEQGAGFMADGYARATGKPGVAFVISGPGLTNIMTPMGQAYSDSVPMLVISSCLPETATRTGRLHQMRDQLGAAETVCEWSLLAEDPETAFEYIDRAFAEFATTRLRPKHLSIPIPVLEGPGGQAPHPKTATPDLGYDSADVEKIAGLIARARKPLFIFGGGTVTSSDAAHALTQKAGAAVFTTYAGRGVVPASYPLSFGATLSQPDSAAIMKSADLLVAIGTELAEVDIWRDSLGHSCPLVRIDIDETVTDDVHNADIRICADAGAVMTAISDQLSPSAPKWDAASVATTKSAFRANCDADRPGIVPLCDAIRATVPADTMFFSDMTQFAYVAKEVYPMERPGHWHHPFGFGTLGYALPAAIGGKIARPNCPVIAIAGDYGFQYTMQELGVAAELGLTLPIILWDNGKLKEIEDCMIGSQIAPNAVVAQNPDFGKLADAYGIAYAKPGSIPDFQKALKAALQADGPTIVHIKPETSSSS